MLVGILLTPTIFLFLLTGFTMMWSILSSTSSFTIFTAETTFLLGVSLYFLSNFQLAKVGVHTFFVGVLFVLRASFFLFSFFFVCRLCFLNLVINILNCLNINIFRDMVLITYIIIKIFIKVDTIKVQNIILVIFFISFTIILLLSQRLCFQHDRLVIRHIFIKILISHISYLGFISKNLLLFCLDRNLYFSIIYSSMCSISPVTSSLPDPLPLF